MTNTAMSVMRGFGYLELSTPALLAGRRHRARARPDCRGGAGRSDAGPEQLRSRTARLRHRGILHLGHRNSYKLSGAPTSDGVWNTEPAATAPYTTRIVVVRPTDPKKFNGTVVVEWLNVSGGVDAGVDWNTTHREITRNGYAYVGVSAQKVGVDWRPECDGVKYAPEEGESRAVRTAGASRRRVLYDLFSQAGRAVRSTDRVRVLGPLVPQRVLAIGESQSAILLRRT